MSSKPRSNPPALPSGTVTFLFTDIEGSTRLWATQHDAMRASLARHDALLREHIEAHGGHVFKTAGDAFCASFATATSAVEAALAAQRALRTERWPEGAAIHARMALHTGAAEIRDGDYFGPPLNHVARLLAVGHGGQTLVSELTHDLCRDRLPAETTLKSLGEHSLKDLSRRETVFQLCHPDLSQAFPPLKTFAAVDENVPSIAVLPFTDLSPEKDQEYFTDGLSEELLNVLSKIRSLRVASRTSAFYFKGKDVDIPTIAQKLNVATILEGSVRKSGKRVRITAQLIQVATDSHLWSETYDRELEDIFAVQDDIAQSVVKELRTALLGEKADASATAVAKAEVRAAAKGRGENAEAHRLYLQARFFEDRLTNEDTKKAIGFYRQAIAIDPQFALAWAGLSRSHRYQAGYSWALDIAKDFDKAREAAERALQLEPDLAEGHASLGFIRMLHDWDWKGADESLRRALELAPGDVHVMRDRAMLLGILCRLDEALALLRRAAALDPLSVQVHRTLTATCVRADLLDEAETAGEKALELDPRGGLTHAWLGAVRLLQGRLDEAEELFRQEVHDTFRLQGLAFVFHARGNRTKSDAALSALIEKNAANGAFQIAEAYAYRDQADLAFTWLERAYAQHDAGIGMTKVARPLRSLHRDPRWEPLLAKIGLAG